MVLLDDPRSPKSTAFAEIRRPGQDLLEFIKGLTSEHEDVVLSLSGAPDKDDNYDLGVEDSRHQLYSGKQSQRIPLEDTKNELDQMD